VAKYLARLRSSLWRGEDHPELDDPPTLGREFGAIASVLAIRDLIRTRELTDAYRETMDRSLASTDPGSRRRVLFSQLNAEAYGYVFEVDSAIGFVKESVDSGLLDLAWMDRCPPLDAVRKDARFAPLRAEVDGRARKVRAALEER
jgi:serine/threonine-protein kinase